MSSSYDILPNGISNDDYVIQNNKHDPQWAANASRGIVSSHGNQLLEVQKLLQELSEHQNQILESVPLTEDAVLWASRSREFIEQVKKLPEYSKKARAIEAEMQNLTKRIERAKERVQKLNSFWKEKGLQEKKTRTHPAAREKILKGGWFLLFGGFDEPRE